VDRTGQKTFKSFAGVVIAGRGPGLTDQILDQSGERFALCHEWLLYNTEISSNAKCVYLTLKRYAREKASCFPGQKRIMEHLGLSRRAVYECLQSLEKVGFIRIDANAVGRHKTVNTYTLLGMNGQNLPIQNAGEGANNSPSNGQNLPTNEKKSNDTGKAPIPGLKDFTDWFCQEWAKHYPDKGKYPFNGPVDQPAAMKIIKDLGLEKAKKMVQWNWDQNVDVWLKTNVVTLGQFRHFQARIVARMPATDGENKKYQGAKYAN